MYNQNQQDNNQFQKQREEAKILASRMRMGTGVNGLLNGQYGTNPSHYIDSLERFKKDYASYQKSQRQNQKIKRQVQLQRKRLQHLQRQNGRWQRVQSNYQKQRQKYQNNFDRQMLGIKRTPNSNGLAYNPINLQYEKNPQGDKLRTKDQDHKIRGYVRAHNMDFRGNSKYNPITGQDRLGIEKVIPGQLNDRFNRKLYDHYDGMKLKVPSSSVDIRVKANYNYF